MNKIIVSMVSVGILILILLITLFVNNSVAKCDNGHEYNVENDVCFYSALSCKDNENIININGENKCTYYKKGFINNGFFVFILILSIITFLFLLFWLLISGGQKEKNIEFSLFKKEDQISVDQAYKSWCAWKSKEDNIPIIGGKISEGEFDRIEHFSTKKGQERFVKMYIEQFGGRKPGLYVVETSLSRGEKHILDGNADTKKTILNNYSRPKGYPIWSPEDPREQFLQQLAETNPEKAFQMQTQLLEQGIRGREVFKQGSQPNDNPEQNVIAQKPRFLRNRTNYLRRF